jgi:hypothetical protein
MMAKISQPKCTSKWSMTSSSGLPRWAATSAIHLEGFPLVGAEQQMEPGEILPGRFTLQASKHVQISRLRQGAQAGRQVIDQACQLFGLVGFFGFARTALKHLPRVLDLAGHECARHVQRKDRIPCALKVGLTQQHVAAGAAFEPSLEAAVAVEHDQSNAIIGQPMHEGCRKASMAKRHHRAEVVKWYTQFGFALYVDPQSVVVQP